MSLTLAYETARSERRYKPLTELECRNAKPRAKQYKIADGNGLFLLVMPNGQRYWRLRYFFHGKQKQIAFGVYPEVSIVEARGRRDEARKMLRDNIDPSAKRKAVRQLAQLSDQTNTFKEVALDWHKMRAEAWSSRHAFNIKSRLVNDAFPLFGDVPISEIRPSHLRKLIDNIQERGAYDIAKRTLQYCGQIFAYAHSLDKIEMNPSLNLQQLLKRRPTQHFHALPSEELPAFIAKLEHNEAPLTHQTRLATKLLMLTFLRTKELVEAPWSEINFEKRQWIIPAVRMKKGRDHIVPLSTQSIAVLERLKEMAQGSPWLFPARSYHRKHMSNGTILGGIKRMGYNQKMTGHGFRALAMTTILEELRFPFYVVDQQLAHKQSRASGPYNRAQFLTEREDMMQKWGDYIDRITPVPSLNATS